MVTNIFLLAFCVLIAWLLYRFPLQRAKTTEDFRKLFPFFCVLTAFVAFNGLLAFMGMGGLRLAGSAAPLTSLNELESVKSGEGVILRGEISDQNDPMLGDYVAYVDESHLWSPKGLWVDLKNGSVAVGNDTYQAVGWRVDGKGYLYLQANEPVTVVGYADDNVNLSSGEKSKLIRADIVFVGPHEDFVTRARFKQILAAAMVLLNILVVVLLVILPVQECWKGMKSGALIAAQ